MPRKPMKSIGPKKKPGLRNVTVEFSKGGNSTEIQHVNVPAGFAPQLEQNAVEFAKERGLNLKMGSTRGRLMVSFSGISQERWDAIFGKKRKK